jgi:4-oxalocrotonate tautomerase
MFYIRKGENIMPLVRISLTKGTSAHFSMEVGEIVYQAMRSTIAIPAHDHFQIITEHDHTSLIYDPTYLDIERTDV